MLSTTIADNVLQLSNALVSINEAA